MAEDNKLTKDHNRDNILLLLTDQATALAANAVKIQLHTERIKQSCCKPGTVGEAYKKLLLAETKDLEGVVAQHKSAAKHLLSVADKLTNGAPVDEIVDEMRIYNTFLADQLKSGEKQACNALNMFLKDLSKSLSTEKDADYRK
ncbi:MAG: hypothetical protein ACE5KZ_12660 [Candidatus Scalinduaceae bacterium]